MIFMLIHVHVHRIINVQYYMYVYLTTHTYLVYLDEYNPPPLTTGTGIYIYNPQYWGFGISLVNLFKY